MRTMPSALVVSVSLLLIAAFAQGQRQTEIYIPIGQSPGVSNTETYIGPITKLDSATGEIAVESGGTAHIVTITDKTRIWLDRSKQKLSNQEGQISDLKVGRTVEIKYTKPTPRMTADWIKVEVAN